MTQQLWSALAFVAIAGMALGTSTAQFINNRSPFHWVLLSTLLLVCALFLASQNITKRITIHSGTVTEIQPYTAWADNPIEITIPPGAVFEPIASATKRDAVDPVEAEGRSSQAPTSTRD